MFYQSVLASFSDDGDFTDHDTSHSDHDDVTDLATHTENYIFARDPEHDDIQHDYHSAVDKYEYVS